MNNVWEFVWDLVIELMQIVLTVCFLLFITWLLDANFVLIVLGYLIANSVSQDRRLDKLEKSQECTIQYVEEINDTVEKLEDERAE